MTKKTPPIRILGHDPQLLKKAADVMPGIDLRSLVDRMREAMSFYDGVGIAAPQIGEPLRVFLIDKEIFQKDVQEKLLSDVFVNPRLIKRSFKRVDGEEGCLSLPKVFGSVNRSARVTLEAFDLHWKKIRITAEDLLARVFQHELDHLDGKLFVHRAKKETLHELLVNGDVRPWELSGGKRS